MSLSQAVTLYLTFGLGIWVGAWIVRLSDGVDDYDPLPKAMSVIRGLFLGVLAWPFLIIFIIQYFVERKLNEK